MKLRRLEIHNIASIADATIDFDRPPLSGAGIFLISGPTGSGKSTILDSIVLALYGEAPRFNRAPRSQARPEMPKEADVRPGDVRNILRHGTGEGSVTLTFRGSNGVEYSSEWRARRSRGNPGGRLMPASHSLTRLSDGAIFTRKQEIAREIIEAVGLDFDQFCRTVMLPQGEFTRFLYAGDADKAALLEKITRVDIYTRIGAAIYSRARSKTEEYQIARRIADETNGMTEEEETAVAAELKAAVDSEAKAEALVKKIQAHIERSRRIADAEAEVAEGREAVEAAAGIALSDEVVGRRRRVERWNISAEARNHLMIADKAASERSGAIVRLGDLSGEIAFFVRSGDSLAEEIKELETTLAELRSRVDVSPERKELLRLGDTILSESKAVEEGRRMLDSTRGIISAHIEEAGRRKHEVEEMKTEVSEAERVAVERRGAYESLKDSVDKFAVAMRATLTEGCRCPVCRQTVVVLPEAEEALHAAAADARAASEAAEKRFGDLSKALSRAEADLRSLVEKTIPAARKMAGTQEEALERHLRALDLALQPIHDSALMNHGESPSDLGQRLKADYETLMADALMYEKISGSLRVKREALRSTQTALEKIRSTAGQYLDLSASPLKSRRKLPDLLEEVTSLGAAISAALKSESDSRALVRAFLDAPDNDFTEEEMRALSAHSHLFILRETDEIRKIDNDVATSRKILADRLIALRSVRRLAADPLPAEVADRDPELVLDEAVKRADDARTVVIDCRTRLARSEENRALRRLRESEALRIKAEADRWESLNRLLGSATGDKLRRIAQSLILSSLTDSANRYMATLAPRYRLKVAPGTFNIMVEDAYQGFASRPASTVSGGESFLVSLALALALSDIGSSLSVDTLFIDEGFGTLSGDALEYALATLSDLRSRSNRRVGIISHVSELRDRIDVHIDVSRSGLSVSD